MPLKHNAIFTGNTVTKNSIRQLSLNCSLMSAIQCSSIEHHYPSCTDSKTINPQLALITIPEAYFLFILDFIIPAVNSFYIHNTHTPSGISMSSSIIYPNQLFKLISEFKLTSLIKKKSILVLSKIIYN